MPLIKSGCLVEDPWRVLDDSEALPAGVPVIVSLARWQAQRKDLERHDDGLGLRLLSHERPEGIAGDLAHFHVITLEFPSFRDGRAYSSARLLRERYGYQGELRAVGNVLRDQLLFMLRCGFDAFEIDDPNPLEIWEKAVGAFSVWYQTTADGRTPASALRARRHLRSGRVAS